jgi:hypothetical protein
MPEKQALSSYNNRLSLRRDYREMRKRPHTR